MKLFKSKSKNFILLVAILSLSFMVHQSSSHEGNYRVVMIPGWHGDGTIFKTMIPIFQSQGLSIVDFDSSIAGVQAINHDAAGCNTYECGNLDIAGLADQVEEQIKLKQTSPNEKFDVVAHSMGGLIIRYLIEKGPIDPYIDDNWAQRIDDVIMLGTPNHGTWEAYVGQLSPLFNDWAASATQMKPGSTFLNSLGYSVPSGEHYTCVGGEPWYLDQHWGDYNGDGISRGFDGVVPSDSPWMNGCDNYIFDAHHGELATKPQVLDVALNTLGYNSPNQGEDVPLYGSLSVRLEYFKMAGDHELFTEEYYLDVYADLDGGNNNFVFVGTLNYNADGPFIKNWGNSGPSTGQIELPQSSSRIDIKVNLREDADAINTFYFYNVMLSEDVDGVDYYSDTAPDPQGGTNEIRISTNGFTFDISQTVDTKVVFTQARIDNDGDYFGNGENYFKVWVGRQGYEINYNQWATWSGEDVYYIYNTYAPGSSYDALLFNARMVKTGKLHLRMETWDDDGIGDDHLNADLNINLIAQQAGGSYYWDCGDAAYWISIQVS